MDGVVLLGLAQIIGLALLPLALVSLFLHARGLLADGGRYRISQGTEIGRPSVLEGRIDADATAVTRAYVAGLVHPIARGQIRVP